MLTGSNRLSWPLGINTCEVSRHTTKLCSLLLIQEYSITIQVVLHTSCDLPALDAQKEPLLQQDQSVCIYAWSKFWAGNHHPQSITPFWSTKCRHAWSLSSSQSWGWRCLIAVFQFHASLIKFFHDHVHIKVCPGNSSTMYARVNP